MNTSKLWFVSSRFLLLLIVTGSSDARLPLFRKLPSLAKISHVSCADLPTKLEPMKNLSRELGCALYIKRDDCTGKIKTDGTRACGGNKVRKLEFLLADALEKGATHVLTFGCAGSNHALATAAYAHQKGCKATCFLSDQVNSSIVRRNLLLELFHGAEIIVCSSQDRLSLSNSYIQRIKAETGKEPYLIPVGGSTPLGVLGYINAVYELQDQIAVGLMPQPDFIYVAAGSYGTVVGLLIGLQLIKSPIRVVAVPVVLNPQDIIAPIKKLFEETRDFLISYDSGFETLKFDESQVIPRYECRGNGYGRSTQATEEAKKIFSKESIILEDTYSAKAAAGLIHDAKSGRLTRAAVLFWHTFYGEPCTDLCAKVNYTDLPKQFHSYFQ